MDHLKQTKVPNFPECRSEFKFKKKGDSLNGTQSRKNFTQNKNNRNLCEIS